MSTELSFLIDLLLDHKLPKATREAVAARIKDVEASRSALSPIPARAIPPGLANQAPSTIANLIKHTDLIPPEPQSVAVIAQTPAAAAALASREQAISQAVSGVVEKGRTSPRKF